MKVEIKNGGEVIWARDSNSLGNSFSGVLKGRHSKK
jgi:hypothetical protein